MLNQVQHNEVSKGSIVHIDNTSIEVRLSELDSETHKAITKSQKIETKSPTQKPSPSRCQRFRPHF